MISIPLLQGEYEGTDPIASCIYSIYVKFSPEPTACGYPIPEVANFSLREKPNEETLANDMYWRNLVKI